MPKKVHPQQFAELTKTPITPDILGRKIVSIVANSTTCQAQVDSIDAATGKYQIRLTGTVECEPQTSPAKLKEA